jgi:phosphatidylserine/phosphatidylglycerophosphate/cardiolipin synthase-like enzyme
MNRFIQILFLSMICHYTMAQFVIFGNPRQSNITNNGFTVGFTTNISAGSIIKYGTTNSLELGYIANGQNTTNHSINLSGLNPATFYFVRPCAINGADTVQSTKTYLYSTASNSSGVIKVFFNGSIDTDVSTGTFPNLSNSPAAIQAEMIKRIDSARSKIDCSVYNNNTSAIVTALNSAHNRGVRVRYIADDGTSNTALSAAQFPVLFINGLDLMHNKFMITDVDSVNKSYVWTGSMNWTSNNINDDYNNVILIQDQALAKAYVVEFDEMWGSSGSSPNASLSKAGNLKTDNTPHFFNIGGKSIECYFSPSDKTTEQIDKALQSAGGDLQVALLTLTRNDLGASIIAKHQGGETVACIIENINDQGSEFVDLTNAGVDAMQHTLPHDIHHKYGIVDANTPNSDPIVITGSHNWSTAAETVNDENTLIIHDAEIANWFLQEFSQRYCELKGGTSCIYNPPIATETLESVDFTVNIFPNPASDRFSVEFSASNSLNLIIFNQLGQKHAAYELGSGVHEISSRDLDNGIYYLQFTNGKSTKLEKLLIMK